MTPTALVLLLLFTLYASRRRFETDEEWQKRKRANHD